MYQFRGLGRIDQVKLGVDGRPMINVTSIDVGPLTPATTGSFTSGGEGPHGGGRTGTGITVAGGMSTGGGVRSPYGGPVWGPKSAPTTPPTLPVTPLPTFPGPSLPTPPIATNPSNPSEPAPSGAQVSVSSPPAWTQTFAGKGWLVAGLGILAVGIAAIAGYAHTHH